jgi:FtsZ-binding cell division protein ZapB
MNEGYEETMEASAETGTFENSSTELEEKDTESSISVPELVPDEPGLPSVSANDLPAILPDLPVEPSGTDDFVEVPAEPPQVPDNTEEGPADSTASIAELLENAQDFDELLAVVRELSETVSAQTYAAEPSGLPMNGYGDYDYPVSVVYRIFSPALGSETGYSGIYNSSEEFNEAYKDLQADVQAGNLSYCYVRYVYDASDECVYDSEEYSLPGIPVDGYEGYSYPVTIKYCIFPPDLGKETFVSKTVSNPEEFEADYKEMQRAVNAGNLNYCYISTVMDTESVLVYDAEAVLEQPEISDETMDAVLESLGSIETDIQSILDADAAHHMEMMSLQEQNTALLQDAYTLQQQNETLQKEILASNVAVGFVLILTLGYTVAHGFFQRMKVG